MVDFVSVERKLREQAYGYLVARRSQKLGLSLSKLATLPDAAVSERMQAMKDYRAELDALPDAALHACWREEAERERQTNAALAEFRDQQTFPLANFTYWTKADYWTCEEAVALLLGREPDREGWDRIRRCVNVSAYAKRNAALRTLAIRSAEMGFGGSVHPRVAVHWARRIIDGLGVELPQALLQAFPDAPAPKVNPYLPPPAIVLSVAAPAVTPPPGGLEPVATPVPAPEPAAVAAVAPVIKEDSANAMAGESKRLEWWESKYDILEMAQNKGEVRHRKRESTSALQLSREIAQTIWAEERRTGTKYANLKEPGSETIRKKCLIGWKFKSQD